MVKSFKVTTLSLLVALTLILAACSGTTGGGGNTPGAPQITAFTANPSSITAAGEAVTLSWAVTGTVTNLSIDNSVGTVSGSTITVNPTATTTYTLTASNSGGNDTASATVTVGGGTGGGGVPTGTFGGSTSQTGPFQNDSGGGITDANDSRIIRAQPNSTIYFQAVYTDPYGIDSAVPYLANKNVDTELIPGAVVQGFESAAPAGCVFGTTQTSITCTFAIAVGDIPNITGIPEFAGEFAYVFKVNVTDTTGVATTNSSRVYVTVGESVIDPTDPTTTDPTDPTNPDPTNQPPTVSIIGDEVRETQLSVNNLQANASDPDGDTLTYLWEFIENGEVANGTITEPTQAATTVDFGETGEFRLQVTVSDGKGGTAKDTVNFVVTLSGM